MTDASVTKEGPSNDQDNLKNNVAQFEKAFRELTSELFMKRNEVNKLKSELEEAHYENHSLKESLEKLRKISEENKITMDMFMKRTREFEPKFYEKRDALIKLELKYKMETLQNNTFREDYHKIALEKAQLIRKVDILEEKRKRDLIYSNDIPQKLAELKSAIGVIKGDIQHVRKEQSYVVALTQETDLAQDGVQKCEALIKRLNDLKLEKDILEEQCVKFKAKSDRLESLISENNCIIDADNLEARVLLAQCNKMSVYYKQKMNTTFETLANFNDNLCQEKETNVKLISDNEDKRKRIQSLETILRELQSKLNFYEPARENEAGLLLQETPNLEEVKIEEEVIEIQDSQ